MSSLDIISMGVRNLFKRKLRAFLTILGVVIGTTAIVTMMSIGIGINESFEQRMEQMGDLTLITVHRPYDTYMASSDGSTSFQSAAGRPSLNDEAIQNFNKLEGVIIATPVMQAHLKFVSGKYHAQISVKGMYPDAMEALGYKIDDGRMILSGANGYEIMFGSEIPYMFSNPGDRNAWKNMYGDNRTTKVDLMNDKISMHYDWSYGEKNNQNSAGLKGYNLITAGVLSFVDAWNGYETNNYAFMDITKLKKIQDDQKAAERKSGVRNNNSDTYKGYEMVYVKCADIKTVTSVLETIRDEMNFEAYNPTDYVNTMKEMSASLQMMLGAIGGVSLFVAAIGIANTMVMSIYERTREIGIMKVIGASINDIKKLFLLEAALIGFIGGFFGLLLSLVLSHIINTVGLSILSAITYNPEGGTVSSIPVWLCGAALAFASFIGLISGYFPARRATKISALTAIRTE